ncbi:conserved domain protein [Bacteroides clarus YIT 12056]|uniref:Conserved domain protein n=1 Tax=Bacteroides clarus YIT 12056 TaxID=762984 RepID=A0ABP2KUB1_9BACE|nr:conserved domain protein [Bacteroides clarus YIT 12056]
MRLSTSGLRITLLYKSLAWSYCLLLFSCTVLPEPQGWDNNINSFHAILYYG